jgi:hypothetical protein
MSKSMCDRSRSRACCCCPQPTRHRCDREQRRPRLGVPRRGHRRRLPRSGFASLLMDFLLPASLGTKEGLSRFDTGLLAARTVVSVDWTRRQAELCGGSIGCMGFGAAASGVLMAAAERPGDDRCRRDSRRSLEVRGHDCPFIADAAASCHTRTRQGDRP